MEKRKFSKKLLETTGIAVVAIAAEPATSKVISVDDRPSEITYQDIFHAHHVSHPWDVDGDGTTDFNLEFVVVSNDPSAGGNFGTCSGYCIEWNGATVDFHAALVALNQFGEKVERSGSAISLQKTRIVGATLTNGYNWGDWGDGDRRPDPPMLRVDAAHITGFRGSKLPNPGFFSFSFIAYKSAGILGAGEHLFGFRFGNSSDALFYGWANLEIDLENESVRIDEWVYNDTPNTPVRVGTRAVVVTEPSTTLPSLALLALGAAGVRSWRRRH